MNNLNIIKTTQFLNPNNFQFRFALDDEDLKTLKNIVDIILSIESIKFLNFIYYDELLKDLSNNEFTYSDTMIILTELTIREIETLFYEQGKNIQPSYIEQYSKDIVSTNNWNDILKFIYQEDNGLNVENLKILY